VGLPHLRGRKRRVFCEGLSGSARRSIVSNHVESAEKIWVIGGGQFGLRAARLLSRDVPAPTITLVDRRSLSVNDEHFEIVTGDGVSWLYEHLSPDARVSKIIPAVPFHLAARWLQAQLGNARQTWHQQTIPEWLLDRFPHPFLTADGSVALSYADFLCPPDCEEPEGYCTHTGEPRPTPLHRYVETVDCPPYHVLVLRSRQFGPGVGGFYPEDLWNLLARARKYRERSLLIVTACSCHGIATLLCPNGLPSDIPLDT